MRLSLDVYRASNLQTDKYFLIYKQGHVFVNLPLLLNIENSRAITQEVREVYTACSVKFCIGFSFCLLD